MIIFAGFDISKSMNEFYGGHGMKLREKFWLWGQSPGGPYFTHYLWTNDHVVLMLLDPGAHILYTLDT